MKMAQCERITQVLSLLYSSVGPGISSLIQKAFQQHLSFIDFSCQCLAKVKATRAQVIDSLDGLQDRHLCTHTATIRLEGRCQIIDPFRIRLSSFNEFYQTFIRIKTAT